MNGRWNSQNLPPAKSSTSYLTAQETFEHYENRPHSGLGSNGSQDSQILACEYRVAPGQIAGGYRQATMPISREYRADTHLPDKHVMYRADVPQPTVTAFIPPNEKKKVPLAAILAAAICVPIFLIVVLFGAVWLQELGIL